MKNTVSALKAHISLNVKDVSKSVKFYQKLFGIEPSKVRQGYAKFDVQNPPLNLALNEARFTERGALSHLGIQVATTEDVLEIKKTWEQTGLKTKDEMQTDCCYALQDKTWVNDPDGNGWEVFVVLEDNLSEAAVCCVTDNVDVSTKEIAASNRTADCCSTPIETKNAVITCC
jgi:predicted lactoylglutathione lyase